MEKLVEYEKKSLGANRKWDGDCLNGIAYDQYNDM